jgi:hypothetical protein
MVHPPVTDTGWVTDAMREQVAASLTLIHIASPDEVAEVIPPAMASTWGPLIDEALAFAERCPVKPSRQPRR